MIGKTPNDIRDVRVAGKYLIQRELGRGGMGVVYLATDTDLHRDVALKMVQPTLARDERSLARFKREARAVAALSHPCIVHINALTEVDGVLFIEMPYLPHGSLRDMANQQLPAGSVAGILDKMLDALACCHEQGIIHRDVKPSNILFDANGVPKLSDFGAAALVETEWSMGQGERTLTLSFSGTPQYCCPEAWDGQTPAPAWDLYALGMVGREMLHGHRRPSRGTPLAHIRQLLEAEEEPIRTLEPALSEPFGALLDCLTARDPVKRPASAVEARERLRQTSEFASSADAESPTVSFGRPPLWRRARRATVPGVPRWAGRRVWRAAPWVLAAVFGALFAAYQLETPASGRGPAPGVRESAPAAPAPTQRERFQNAAPPASVLPQLLRAPTQGRSRVYTLRSARHPDTGADFVFHKTPGEDDVTAMGLLDGALHFLALDPGPAAGQYALTGFAGEYAAGAGPLLQSSRLQGRVDWDGALDTPMWLAITYESELAAESWTDALVGAPHAGSRTDTAVVKAWEAHETAMPFLFRELLPRYPAVLAPAFQWLPSTFGSQLAADPGAGDRDLRAGDDLPSVAALYDATVPARPYSGGAWLAADHDGARFRVAVAAPDPDREIGRFDLCLMPRYDVPRAASPFLRLAWDGNAWDAEWVDGDERTPVLDGWQGEWRARPDGALAVITIAFETLHLSPTLPPDTWFRLNAALEQSDASATMVHEWGWPELEAVEHGALVEVRL